MNVDLKSESWLKKWKWIKTFEGGLWQWKWVKKCSGLKSESGFEKWKWIKKVDVDHESESKWFCVSVSGFDK